MINPKATIGRSDVACVYRADDVVPRDDPYRIDSALPDYFRLPYQASYTAPHGIQCVTPQTGGPGSTGTRNRRHRELPVHGKEVRPAVLLGRSADLPGTWVEATGRGNAQVPRLDSQPEFFS